jgi:hypothetical protein
MIRFASLFLGLVFVASAFAQPAKPIVSQRTIFEEVDGVVSVEAEHFHAQTETRKRAWFLFTPDDQPKIDPDPDGVHLDDASGGAYLEILPDTRATHGDKLRSGENFSNEPGRLAVLHYKVYFNNPGKYYVWARIHSTGTEDNGLHVGINGQWPESGQRMQWTGKNKWVWDSKQRTDKVHTGVKHLLYLEVPKAGYHVISFSMREDGTEFDKWMMTKEQLEKVDGAGPETKLKSGKLPEPFAATDGDNNMTETAVKFDADNDLISLHYDHAPDKDDGHSAAADRSMLETIYSADWLAEHTLRVSGAYGTNRKTFNKKSDKVMDTVFGEKNWVAADDDWDIAVDAIVKRWLTTLQAGGDVWVKEGGQSDITADVIRIIRDEHKDIDTTQRIHVVQHSNWNENKTTKADLAYVKQHTNYIRIKDANRFLNVKGGNKAFEQAALAHPVFGPSWAAAFEYYPTKHRLDFSDTGELMRILDLGEIGIDEFREKYLKTDR